MDLAQAAEVAEGVGDRLARRQAPAGDADDLAAGRVDRGEHDVGALRRSSSSIRGRSARSEVVSASRVTIASSSEDSPSAARRPVLIAVPRPRLTVWRTTARCRSLRRARGSPRRCRRSSRRRRRSRGRRARGRPGARSASRRGDVLGLVVGGDDEADHAQTSRRPGGGDVEQLDRAARPRPTRARRAPRRARLTPSWALTGSGVSSSTQRQKASSSARSGSALAQREAHRGALAVAAQHREPVPVQRRARRLDEPDVLGDVAGAAAARSRRSGRSRASSPGSAS